MMQYVGQPMQVVMVVKYYHGTPWSSEMNPAVSKKHQEPEMQPWALLATLSPSLCSSSSCHSSQRLLCSLLPIDCLILFCPVFSVPCHLASNCFLMANPSRFNSTFSLCASWLQFHCQLPNSLPCLCTEITHGCRPHVRIDLRGSGTSCQLGGGTDSDELTSFFWGLPLQRDCGCGGQSYVPGQWKLQ